MAKGPTAASHDPDVDYASDANAVDWDGPDDPQNPMNWPFWRKTGVITCVSIARLITPLASSMMAPALPQIERDFHLSGGHLVLLSITIYVIGFGLGPLILAPMSELYGRRVIYNTSSVLFTALAIGCATAPGIGVLVAFRLLAGMAGGVPPTIGGGIVADMVAPDRRGIIMATGALTIASIILLRETYPPLLLSQRAARLRKETGNTLLRPKGNPPLPKRELFFRAIARPLKMLFSPVNAILALYLSIIHGIIYLIITTLPVVFQVRYGFSEGLSGVACIGVGLGIIVALILLGHYSDVVYKRLTAANHGRAKPEFRLIFQVYGTLIAPAGLIIYGWTAQEKLHWVIPIIGASIFGVGSIIAFTTTQTYLIDAFTEHAASALAANSFLRSIAAGVLPLAGLSLNNSLGLGWSNVLLGLLALAFGVPPAILYWYGEGLRKRYPVS
ncbi:MAG: hypothetical protein M1840_005162 [Geoglossum simile]|nr:MAG: hypothetical protein M1840_005162 [Geoglossum simile]